MATAAGREDAHRADCTAARDHAAARSRCLEHQASGRLACRGFDRRAATRAAPLLVRHDQQADRAEARRPSAAERGDRVHRGCQRALHVADARTAEPAGIGAERPVGQRADRPDRVGVAEDQDRRAVAQAEACIEQRAAAPDRLQRDVAARVGCDHAKCGADRGHAVGGLGRALDAHEPARQIDDGVELAFERSGELGGIHGAQQPSRGIRAECSRRATASSPS